MWDVNFNNAIASKTIETKTNSNSFIGYLDEVIRPLVLILPKMKKDVKILTLKMEIKIKTIN